MTFPCCYLEHPTIQRGGQWGPSEVLCFYSPLPSCPTFEALTCPFQGFQANFKVTLNWTWIFTIIRLERRNGWVEVDHQQAEKLWVGIQALPGSTNEVDSMSSGGIHCHDWFHNVAICQTALTAFPFPLQRQTGWSSLVLALPHAHGGSNIWVTLIYLSQYLSASGIFQCLSYISVPLKYLSDSHIFEWLSNIWVPLVYLSGSQILEWLSIFGNAA